MKVRYIFVVAIVFGYLAGIGLEYLAEGQESKIQQLVSGSTVSFFELPTFLKSAQLSETSTSIIDTANVGWDVVPLLVNAGTQNAGFINTPECVFHSSESVSHNTCVICVLNPSEEDENWDISGLASGRIELPDGYTGSTTINIPMTDPDPLWEPVDIKQVMSVLIGLCKEDGQGCTPGFWKTHSILGPATPDSWPNTVLETDDFETLFQFPLGHPPSFHLTVQIDNMPVQHPNLIEAVSAQGGGVNALTRHAMAAWLNAESGIFSLSTQEVIDAYLAAYQSGDWEATKDNFDLLNNLGCPFGNNPNDASEADAFSETGGVDTSTVSPTPVTPFELYVDSISQLQTLYGQTVNIITQADLTNAISLLSAVVEGVDGADYWINDYHINMVTGQVVLDNSKQAINSLYFITASGSETVTFNDSVQAVIDQLISADSTLAQTAIDDVLACGGSNPKIANHLSNAQTKLSQAIVDSNDKKYGMAVDKFFDAWYEAFMATLSCPAGYWTELDGYEVVT